MNYYYYQWLQYHTKMNSCFLEPAASLAPTQLAPHSGAGWGMQAGEVRPTLPNLTLRGAHPSAVGWPAKVSVPGGPWAASLGK